MPITTTTIAGGVKITGTGADELLTGGTGNDLIISNGGADTINGGAGTDTVAMLTAQSGYSWSGTANDFILHPIAGGGDKHIVNAEDVQFSSGTVTTASLFAAPAAPVHTVTGTGADESLTGTSGNDLIISNGGADTIDAGAGTDTVAMLATKSGYSWSGTASDFILHPIAGGGDKHVLNDEFVQFKDVTVSTASLFQSTLSGGSGGTTTSGSGSTGTASTGASGAGSSLITTVPAGAHIIHMGANETYHTLSSALAAAGNGDVIQVDAGTYSNDTATVAKNVTIQGVGGLAHFQSSGDIANDKAILIDDAASLTLQNLEFSGAQVADGNGAGIRFEAGALTIQNSYFHDNQDGILGGVVSGGRISVDHSQFYNNGAGDGQTHQLYAGVITALSVTNSSFIDANGGIDVKSRAATSTITGNSFLDSKTGTTTYEVDLPNGGNATISGNSFYKSADTGNRATIHFGGELAGASGNLLVDHNNIWSDRDPTSVVLNQTQSTVSVTNNGLQSTVSIPVDVGHGSVSGNIALTGAAPDPLHLYG